ncbi:MAG TPA: RimK-like ATPgrasp N-terminal domain-containing protein, partial [Phycisphaerae bacterium]
EVIQTVDEAVAKVRSLTLNYKYAFVCEALPNDCRIDVCRCVIGRCLTREYEPFAAKVFATFRLPLMRVHVIVTPEAYLFSAIAPLPRDSLTLGEKGILKEAGLWTM